MRPAQIRVFDGLRLTTEHLDHMQNALRSSIEDLREIAGLGVVFRGFEVVASGDHAITVQPGLAFDFARKRLARDEPLTVEVQIEAGAAQFVCLKYDQIEDGQVEDQFTLIWDSCSAVVQPTLPTPEDNLLALAIVSRADDGSLAITSLQPTEEEGAAPTHEETGAGAPAEPDTTNGTPANDGAPVPSGDGASVPTTDGAGAPSTTNGQPSAPTDASASVPASDAPAPAPDAAPPAAPAWLVWQGVARLAGTDSSAVDLATILVGPLRNRLAGTEPGSGDLRFNLHQTDIAVRGAVRTLTTHALLDATWTPADGTTVHVSAKAEGEATFGGTTLAHYGISTLRTRTGEDGTPLWTTELTERGVAHLLLGGAMVNAPPSLADDPLRYVQLVLRVDAATSEGFKIVCDLVWVGAISETLIDQLNATKPTLRWNATLAWKAWGTEHMQPIVA